MSFSDRRDAGRRLVDRLRAFRGDDVVVLAVPTGGVPVAFEVATALRLPLDVMAPREELAHKEFEYRGGRDPVPLRGRTALIVDDGISTGATAWAVCAHAKAEGAVKIIFAAPVGPSRVIRQLSRLVEHVVCLETPDLPHSVGRWYLDYSEIGDDAVLDLVDRANNRWLQTDRPGAGPPHERHPVG
ncbi:phosphoribosyltransferase family protein [Nocardia sp. NPDC048505]|uniref:phosphoribosyltransferase n=1 Tax=unclassified Nocardia TaxID=2637762 RepID=UPI0033DE3BA3